MITDLMLNDVLASTAISPRATIPESEARKRLELLLVQLAGADREQRTKRYCVADFESVPWQIWEYAHLGGNMVLTSKTATERVFLGTSPEGRSMVAPGELAKQWMYNLAAANGRRMYKNDDRSVWSPVDGEVTDPPRWYRRGVFDPQPMVQVDINAAYASIMTKLPSPIITYDHDERMFGWREGTWEDVDLLRSVKGLGTVVSGMFLTDRMRRFHFGREETVPFLRWRNVPVMRFVMDVLHGIATVAVEEYGCFRWFVDSGVFTPDAARDFRIYLDDIWELPSHVERAGKGQVMGLHDFTIGTDDVGSYPTTRAHHRSDRGRYGLDYATPTDNMLEDALTGPEDVMCHLRRDIDVDWLRQGILFPYQDWKDEETP